MARTHFTVPAVALLALAACGGPAARAADPAEAVSFAKDVKVILAHNCYECHAKDKKKGAFSLNSRELVLKGGENGPNVVPGKADESDLVKRLTTDDEDLRMPPKGPGLTPAEVAILKAWVDQGLKWDEITPADIATRQPQNLKPRRPTVPPGEGQPIDRILSAYLTANGVTPSVVADEVFARRVYLDIVGLPPTPAELAAFAADASPDKRPSLVRRLLADDKAYADHWMTFWQDHLRDGKKDIGTTDIFKPITGWLHHGLLTNKPYDRFVAELVTAKIPKDEMTEKEIEQQEKERQKALTDPDDAEGFLLGQLSGLERPRGDQAWQVQAAQNVGQVFLGVQLKCATCHDSFIDQWTMHDAWSLANVFATEPLEAVRCEQPTGKHFEARFPYPDMGSIDPKAPVADRQQKLAELLTSPRNGRFSRTVVNRLWARLIGRGLVANVDELDGDAWSPDLLDQLAEEFVAGGHDLKKLIETICTSAAYQMPSVDTTTDPGAVAGSAPGGADAKYVFRGPALRRMNAEQFVDAVQAMLGRSERAWRGGGTRLTDMLGRPDRRVVVTSRDAKSSTIQALELMNGQTLYDVLYTDGTGKRLTSDNAAVVKNPSVRSGDGAASTPAATKPSAPAKRVAGSATKPSNKTAVSATIPASAAKPSAVTVSGPKANPKAAELAKLPPRELADQLLRHGLSRPPAERESAILAEMLGGRPTAETVADAVWMVALLPEFQLVR